MRKQSQLTALLFHVEQVTACYGRGNDTVNDSSERDWQGMPDKVGLLREEVGTLPMRPEQQQSIWYRYIDGVGGGV